MGVSLPEDTVKWVANRARNEAMLAWNERKKAQSAAR
jgi:hypothetical protein